MRLLLVFGSYDNTSVGLNTLGVCCYTVYVLEVGVNYPSLSGAHSLHSYLAA